MSVTPSLLFTPWSIGRLQLPNRIVVPPMCMYMADNGKMSAFHYMHTGSMATSGAGLHIIEATAVTPEGRISPRCVGLWNDETAAAMKAVLQHVRQFSSTPIAVQLIHAGRKASSYPPMAKRPDPSVSVVPETEGGWQREAPSAVSFRASDPAPRALSLDDIRRITEAFAAAAKRAEALGLDGVELHYAHGYLAHQFLSPLSNQRTDQYGGSLENRMRLPLEVFDAVKAAVSADFPVWVRLSADDWAEGGWTLDESIVLCRALKERGCPVVHVSSGGLSAAQQVPARPGYQLHFAQAIRDQVKIPTIAVGLVTEPTAAEQALGSGQCDAVAVGRQMLFNPHWPYEAARQLGAKVIAPPSYWRSVPGIWEGENQ